MWECATVFTSGLFAKNSLNVDMVMGLVGPKLLGRVYVVDLCAPPCDWLFAPAGLVRCPALVPSACGRGALT